MSDAPTLPGPIVPSHVVDEAIGWMVASREGLTGEEQAALAAWLDADAQHRAAWRRLEGALNPFRAMEAQRVSGEKLVASLAQQRLSRRAVIGNGAMAVGALATSIGLADRISPVSGLFADYRTATGQRRRFSLPDGSRLVLDARSEADLAAKGLGRGIALRSGMAFLKVRPGDAPFTVSSGEATASLAEGSLVVSRRSDAFRLICTEGRADLSLSGRRVASAAAGTGFAVEKGGVRPLPQEETRDAASWLDGRLILHDRQLGDLIDAFRPYRAGVLSIASEAARLRVSGVFALDRLDDALALVPELFPLRVVQVGSLFTRIDLMPAPLA